MKKILFSVILAIGAQIVGAQDFVPLQVQTIIYVKPDGTGDGSSWAEACNLDDIIDDAAAVGVGLKPTPTPNTQIWVQKGTYYPSAMLIIPDSIKMYGGFSGTETDLSQRDFASNPTIIDAQKKFGSVVRLSPFAELNGFTIQNGASQRSPHKNGGGIWMDDFSTVENCKIINNSASINGGGVYAIGNATIANSTIEQNTAQDNGNNVYGCCITMKNVNGVVPIICSHPSDKAETRTQTFEAFSPLTVSAISSGTLSYKWYSNTVNSTVGGTAVGGDSNVYTPLTDNISNLYYYVVVTNDFGSDTSSVSGLHATISPIINFDYTGVAKEVTLAKGTYIMECWGARGGGTYVSKAGAGGYTYGQIDLHNNTTLYIYVGQYLNTIELTTWNGGRSSGGGHPGGGASDIRITSGAWNEIKSLRSRIMVAAGGGASTPSSFSNYSRHGGGLVGGDASQYTKGGTQTGSVSSYGQNGGFGQNSNLGATGGNGYYGGAGASHAYGGGAGGSSFISGHPGCNAIRDAESTVHTGQPNHYSGLVFTETKMIAGNASMPNPRGTGNMTGNNSHGYVRITRIK